jgi:hypothetical protein
MVGFYEEMADFAAMSEDDGFLGQCAGETIEPPCYPAQPVMWTGPVPVSSHREPQQLQLLVILRQGDETIKTI